MSSESTYSKSHSITLPEDRYINVSGCQCLNDRDICMMELASKAFYDRLSRPRKPLGRRLDLGFVLDAMARNPGYYRWVHKRIMAYSHIVYHYACMPKGRRGFDTNVPPVLPSPLAACAPSTELKLSLAPEQGESFLAMPQDADTLGAIPGLSSFWINQMHHLSDLELQLFTGKGRAYCVGTLNILQNLQKLWLMADWPSVCLSSCTYMSEGFEMKLPHLDSLRVWNHGEGELVLSCPKLSKVWFSHNSSLRIRVKDAIF